MSKVSLKIVIAGRSYPLTVKEEEQEKVLKAAEDINKGIKMLQENYAVKDLQDLLAMTALQLVTKSQKDHAHGVTSVDYSAIESELESLVNDLKKDLNS